MEGVREIIGESKNCVAYHEYSQVLADIARNSHTSTFEHMLASLLRHRIEKRHYRECVNSDARNYK